MKNIRDLKIFGKEKKKALCVDVSAQITKNFSAF